MLDLVQKLGESRYMRKYAGKTPFDPRKWLSTGDMISKMKQGPLHKAYEKDKVVDYINKQTGVLTKKYVDEAKKYMDVLFKNERGPVGNLKEAKNFNTLFNTINSTNELAEVGSATFEALEKGKKKFKFLTEARDILNSKRNIYINNPKNNWDPEIVSKKPAEIIEDLYKYKMEYNRQRLAAESVVKLREEIQGTYLPFILKHSKGKDKVKIPSEVRKKLTEAGLLQIPESALASTENMNSYLEVFPTSMSKKIKKAYKSYIKTNPVKDESTLVKEFVKDHTEGLAANERIYTLKYKGSNGFDLVAPRNASVPIKPFYSVPESGKGTIIDMERTFGSYGKNAKPIKTVGDLQDAVKTTIGKLSREKMKIVENNSHYKDNITDQITALKTFNNNMFKGRTLDKNGPLYSNNIRSTPEGVDEVFNLLETAAILNPKIDSAKYVGKFVEGSALTSGRLTGANGNHIRGQFRQVLQAHQENKMGNVASKSSVWEGDPIVVLQDIAYQTDDIKSFGNIQNLIKNKRNTLKEQAAFMEEIQPARLKKEYNKAMQDRALAASSVAIGGLLGYSVVKDKQKMDELRKKRNQSSK